MTRKRKSDMKEKERRDQSRWIKLTWGQVSHKMRGFSMKGRFFLPLVQLFKQLLSVYCVLGAVLSREVTKSSKVWLASSGRPWIPMWHPRSGVGNSVKQLTWLLLLSSLVSSFPSVSLALPVSASRFFLPAPLSLTTVHNCVFIHRMCCIKFISRIP